MPRRRPDRRPEVAGLARGEAGTSAGGGEAAAPQEALADQTDFLRRHLLRWIPAFAADVEAHAATDFYRALAALLKAFVEADAAFLDRMQDVRPQPLSRSVEV